MTVSVLRNKAQYTGNGSSTQFEITFAYTETSQIKVYLDGSLQTLTTHYTITDPGQTGTVTFVTAPESGVVISLIRETDYLQTVDYANNDILDAETLESAFDKLTMMCQQLKSLIDGSVGFDETVSDAETTSLKLAAGITNLAGKLLAFDATGNFVTTQEIGTWQGDYSVSTAYVVRDIVKNPSTDNVYFTKRNAPAGTSLSNTTYFALLVDVETVRTLKEAAELAENNAETAQAAAEAALASFQGQYKVGATNPYSGTPDAGDLWYDTANSILKYYVSGTGFEPITTSLATVTDNYLTISNQVITAGTVPVTLGGTGSTTASGARTALGLAIGVDVQAYDADTTKNDVSNTFSANQIISVADNVNAALRITQTGTGNAIVVEDDSGNPDSTPFVVDAIGYVGIGRNNPQRPLHVDGGTVQAEVLRLQGGTGALNNPFLTFYKSDGSARNGYIQVAPAFYDIGLDGSGYISFTSNSVERMRIDSSGNVGIGTSSNLLGSLTVFNGTDFSTNSIDSVDNIYLISDATSGDGVYGSSIAFSRAQNPDRRAAAIVSVQTGADEDNVGLAFFTHPSGVPTDPIVEALRIDSSGNVGIGTTSPAQKLDVTGNINATGALTLGTALAITEGGTGQSTASAARIALLPTLGTAGQVLAVNTGTTDVEWVDAASSGGSGTVTSVAISGNDGIEVDSGSPITTSGTINLGINTTTLSNHLGLGTAAFTASTAYATAAQGSLADSAVQPGDNANTLGSGAATDGYVLTADGAGGTAWEAASGGGGGTTAYLEHSSTISDSFTVTSGTNRMYIGGTTFSGTISVAGRLVIVGGEANFTGTINTTGVLAILGVP